MRLKNWITYLKEWVLGVFEIAFALVGIVILVLAEWLEDYPKSNYRSPTSSDND